MDVAADRVQLWAVAATEKNIAIVLAQQGDLKNALLRFKKALAIKEKSLVLGHVSVAMTKENIGYVHKQLGDLEQALACIEEAHTIFLRGLGLDHHNTEKAARALEELQPSSCTVS